MRIAILDDYFDTLRALPCFDKLAAHDVTVFADHVESVDELAARLAPFDALVLIRERTAIRAPLPSTERSDPRRPSVATMGCGRRLLPK